MSKSRAAANLFIDVSEVAARVIARESERLHGTALRFVTNAHYILRRAHAAVEALGGRRPPVFLASATPAKAEAFGRRLAALDEGARLVRVCDHTAARIEELKVNQLPAALARAAAWGEVIERSSSDTSACRNWP